MFGMPKETIGTGLPLDNEQAFLQIQYRTGTRGQTNASIKGTGIRVQTIVIVGTEWTWDVNKIAEEYELSPAQVSEVVPQKKVG